jgi:hypothetical protein
MTWRESRPPLTEAQLAVESLLTRLSALPVGKTIVLADRAQDGFGGLVIKRHAKHILVFQRMGFKARSRWADGPDQAREELETYRTTGKLHEPDNITGW